MSSSFVEEQLPNGLKVVIEVMPGVKSAACGFMTRTGSRDEVPALAGVSHFLEHMCFKGTPTRTWRDLNIAFDDMGSQYNAFTSKDRTFYYGWVRTADITHQMALIADMMRSVLPPDEFDMEKNVVLEEIAMAQDQLEHLAYDLLHEKVFAGASMAWPVLGYNDTVLHLTRDQMKAYFDQRYAPDNLILLVTGNVQPTEIIRTARNLTADWKPIGANLAARRSPPEQQHGSTTQVVSRFKQQAILLAFPAASATHDLNEEATALASILGADNSRFFWNICQAGIAPRASVWHEDYQDCGLMILYGMGEPANAERLTDAMRQQAQSITDNGVEPKEVERVRNKRRTSLAAEGEAPYYRLLQVMEDIDYRGRPRTVEERLDRVGRITADSITAYLKQFPITEAGYLVSVGPRDWPT